MGLTRFELVTPRLSSVCSNQLSYRPSASAGFASFGAARPLPAACLAEACLRLAYAQA